MFYILLAMTDIFQQVVGFINALTPYVVLPNDL